MSYKRMPMGYVPGLVEDTPLDSLRALSTQKGVSTTRPANVGPGPLDFLKNIVGGAFQSITNPPMQAPALPSPAYPAMMPASSGPSMGTVLLIGGGVLAAVLLLKKKG